MILPEEEIRNIVASILKAEQAELVDLKFARAPGRCLLKILVDKDRRGITVAECAKLNRRIGEVLDSSEVIKDRYLLEVSSPGLDRPLSTRNDFLRSLNKVVRFFLKEPVLGKLELTGMIKQIKDESIEVEAENGIIEIPLSKISKARLEIDFS